MITIIQITISAITSDCISINNSPLWEKINQPNNTTVAMHTHASNRIGAEALPIKILSINMRRVTVFCESAIGNKGFILIITEEVTKCQTNMTVIDQLGESVFKVTNHTFKPQ
jgi:hypothetical protein